MSAEIFWMILGFAFLILEIFTTSFFIMWFGLAGLITALASWLWIDSFSIQLVIFAVSSFILVLFTRTLADKVSKDSPRKITQDNIIGKEGIVVETITADNSKGIVKIFGQDWRAVTDGEAEIQKGSYVKILSLRGVKITVKQVKHAE
jgi:membrane protein implicated in regulation of membrane protease activity